MNEDMWVAYCLSCKQELTAGPSKSFAGLRAKNHKDNNKNHDVIFGVYIDNEHPDDCDCGRCSGEDQALEAMERGIVAAEKNYGDD